MERRVKERAVTKLNRYQAASLAGMGGIVAVAIYLFLSSGSFREYRHNVRAEQYADYLCTALQHRAGHDACQK